MGPICMGCCPAVVSDTSSACREISVLHFFLYLEYLWDLGLLQGLILALCEKVVPREKNVEVTDFLSAVHM